MGCDIHLHIEIKAKGEWLHYNQPDVDRNYALFGKMGGDRGHEEPITLPRGIPADATRMTRIDYEYEDVDAHHASWLDSREIAALEEWYEKNWTGFHDEFGYLFGNSFDMFARDSEARADYPAWLEDVRFVFWFDN